MTPFILLCAYLSAAVAEFFYAENECAVSIEYKTGDLTEPQPLILTSDWKRPEFLYPEADKPVLRIPKGQSIYLACPGEGNYVQNGTRTLEKAVCVQGKMFDVGGVPRNFSTLNCNYIPKHEAREVNSPCLDQATTTEIGFQVGDVFLPLMEVCRENKTYSTFYTKFKLTKSIGNAQVGFPRSQNWLSGSHFPGMRIQELYKFNTQFATIARILNSTELAKKHMKMSSQFLSRGHLTAKADYVYGAQHLATFYFINAAPQWQSFNGGNWNTLEDAVRVFASQSKLDLDVYTGVHGQMTMKDVQGMPQPIYLHYDADGNAIPAPKFYWKVIYDPISKKGTAFVGLNDPFIETITGDLYICKDISDKIKWLSWEAKNIKKGISYTCEVDDLRKAVKNVPNFKVAEILA